MVYESNAQTAVMQIRGITLSTKGCSPQSEYLDYVLYADLLFFPGLAN